MNVEQLNEFDDDDFAEWYEPFHASERFSWPDRPGWTEEEIKVFFRDKREVDAKIAVVRDDTGRAIGSLDMSLPVMDNRLLAYLIPAVHPDHRRSGVGASLLKFGEEMASDQGRTTAISHSDEPVSAGPSPAEGFALAMGYTGARANARRELHLPMPEGRLDALEAEAQVFAGEYEIVAWTRNCPDDLASDRVELSRQMSLDAPRGELVQEEELWDLDRLRNWEKNIDEMGSHLVAVGAVETATGALVGFSEMGIPRKTPELAHQFDTIVSRAHRGHRIGLLLKLANARALMDSSPTKRVETSNAVSNKPMIRVNEAMGFVLIGLGQSWQKRLL